MTVRRLTNNLFYDNDYVQVTDLRVANRLTRGSEYFGKFDKKHKYNTANSTNYFQKIENGYVYLFKYFSGCFNPYLVKAKLYSLSDLKNLKSVTVC